MSIICNDSDHYIWVFLCQICSGCCYVDVLSCFQSQAEVKNEAIEVDDADQQQRYALYQFGFECFDNETRHIYFSHSHTSSE